jgi:hypothetical protein
MKTRHFLSVIALAAMSALSADILMAQGRRGGPGKSELDQRSDGRLKEGQKAPDFKLKLIGSKKTVKLSSFKGKKPVVLVFGSYT